MYRMRTLLTISLSEDMAKEVTRISRRLRMNKSELVRNALRKYLPGQRFKTLRTKGLEKGRDAGLFTDENVFEKIS